MKVTICLGIFSIQVKQNYVLLHIALGAFLLDTRCGAVAHVDVEACDEVELHSDVGGFRHTD